MRLGVPGVRTDPLEEFRDLGTPCGKDRMPPMDCLAVWAIRSLKNGRPEDKEIGTILTEPLRKRQAIRSCIYLPRP